MSMFGDIATEATVKNIVIAIKKEIDSGLLSYDSINVLNKIGLIALSQFDYGSPDWADEYFVLFRK